MDKNENGYPGMMGTGPTPRDNMNRSGMGGCPGFCGGNTGGCPGFCGNGGTNGGNVAGGNEGTNGNGSNNGNGNGTNGGNGNGTNHSCGGRGDCLDYMPLAYVYAPDQAFRMLYSAEDALKHGTLFEELYKPMEVYGRE